MASLAENSSEIFKTNILKYAPGIMMRFDVLPYECCYINKTKIIILVLLIQRCCIVI